VVFFGGAVVGPGGLDMVRKAAERNLPAVDVDLCFPKLSVAAPSDALVL